MKILCEVIVIEKDKPQMWYFIFFILAIVFVFFLVVLLGNFLLKKVIDAVLVKKERFQNAGKESFLPQMDACSKNDEIGSEQLNFQTGTNIPISPFYYRNYVGTPYIEESPPSYMNGIFIKNKLLYDGIWESNEKAEAPYMTETWKMTNGDVIEGTYGRVTENLLQMSPKMPNGEVKKDPIQGGYYYTFFNDTQDDVADVEIKCFEGLEGWKPPSIT